MSFLYPRAGYLLLALALAACGSPGPTSDPSNAKDKEGEAALAPGAWQGMSGEEKSRHMKEVVVPRMAPIFRKFDERFAEFGCETCHVDGLADGTFKMPDPGLPRFENYDTAKRDDAVAVAFMEVVENEMAAVLGVPAYDPKTHKGFKCSSCHVLGKGP